MGSMAYSPSQDPWHPQSPQRQRVLRLQDEQEERKQTVNDRLKAYKAKSTDRKR